MLDRRRFLRSMAALTAGLAVPACAREEGPEATPTRDRLGNLLPLRRLGRSSETVTILGVGGWHIGRMSERDAQETIEAALEGGVRFFDSAESYQDGGSEERLGKLLVPKYRDVSFLMTKTLARDGEAARRDLEDSLRRLKTEQIDLMQIHGLETPEDAEARFQNGVVDVLLKAREEGKIRLVGFTGHRVPEAHLRMLELTDTMQTCQMPVNLSDASYQSFIQNVLPVAQRKGVGVLAMKSLANGGFFGGSRQGEHGDNPRVVPNRVSVQEAIQFVWSLPVSVLISGPDSPEHMREKVGLARSFQGMTEARRQELVAKVADMAGPMVEFYKV